MQPGAPANGDQFTVAPSTPTLSVFDTLDRAIGQLATPGRTKAQIAQRMLGALAKSGAPWQPPPGRLDPPPRPTAPKGNGAGFCADCGTAKGPAGELRCECVPF